MTQQEQPRLVNEREAAAILGLAPITLRKARWKGHGPTYVKYRAAVRYSIADLQAWIESHRVQPECVRIEGCR